MAIISFEAFGLEPYEKLKDVDLEKRARLISSELRCLVCQNENIDSSNSEFATDLRIFVRKKLKEGLEDEEINQSVLKLYISQHHIPAPFGLLKNTFSVFPGEIVKLDEYGKLEKKRYLID